MLAAAAFVGWFAEVAAPVGRGRLAALTGWVACQNVPVTAIEPFVTLTFALVDVIAQVVPSGFIDHGAPPWFAVIVPLIGCVAPEPSTRNAPASVVVNGFTVPVV